MVNIFHFGTAQLCVKKWRSTKTKTNTKTMTNTFKEHLQRAILEIFISFLYHIISYHIILYYIIYHIIGNEGGGTPALQLPDGKGRRRGGENPVGGARGGRRCEGELRFFSSKMPTFLHLHNQLVSCGLAVVFTSMYQFSAGKKVRVKRCEV